MKTILTLNTAATPQTRTGWLSRHVWLKRLLIGSASVLVALPIVGLLCQSIGMWMDAATMPAPGELVDVGGRRLHLYCTGENNGNPTVILETLSGGAGACWGWVQPEVAQVTRVCPYDRAGRGWSDPIAEPHDLPETVNDLTVLLDKGKVPGPYVMVGHSIGGLYIREFAAQHPAQVMGMVLLDSSHPDQFARSPEMASGNANDVNSLALLETFTRLGVSRLYFSIGGTFDFGDMPALERSQLQRFWSSSDFQASRRQEVAAAPTIFEQARQLGTLGALPLLVVSSTVGQDARWREFQNELTELSTHSEHRAIEGASHVSLVFNQAHARQTSKAIMDVVRAARGTK